MAPSLRRYLKNLFTVYFIRIQIIMIFLADNQIPRLPPMLPFSEYLLPLNAEMPSSTPVIMQGHNPAMSSAFAGMGKAHSSDASRMELGTMLMSANCNAVSKTYDSWYFSVFLQSGILYHQNLIPSVWIWYPRRRRNLFRGHFHVSRFAANNCRTVNENRYDFVNLIRFCDTRTHLQLE